MIVYPPKSEHSCPERAWRRQSCTCCGRQPWRRATSVTIAPGSKLSAAICAFKSSGQRFPPAPAYTSIRGDGRLMSSEWSSIVSTLAQDDSSNGAPKSPHKQSEGPRRHAYNRTTERRDQAPTDVVGIFPTTTPLIRLVGAILMEQKEKWVCNAPAT